MKSIGFLIFVAGIIIAISAGAKLSPSRLALENSEESSDSSASTGTAAEASPARFPDTVSVFAGGAVLCSIGLTLWWGVVRAERDAARSSANDDSASDNNPVTILHQLQQGLTAMLNDLDELNESELQLRIDSLIDSHVTPLAETRHRIIDRFGMTQGSEILVATAYGERMLNRVWSAAADGYLDEARSSFREAATAFDEAAAIIEPVGSAV